MDDRIQTTVLLDFIINGQLACDDQVAGTALVSADISGTVLMNGRYDGTC